MISMLRRGCLILLSGMVMIMMLAGCAPVNRQAAYTIYPVGWLIQRIGGGNYQAVSLQKEGSLLQNSEIRSDFQDVLKESRVFFHLGDCEPYLEVYKEDIQDTGVAQSDLSVLNAVYDFARYTRTKKNGETVWIESPYYDSDLFTNTDQGRKDLYIWMDPVSMLAMAGTIRNYMIQDDPADKSTYEENYQKLKQELIELDAQYQSLSALADRQSRTISLAVMSTSFGCWQKAYGFRIYPIMLSKYGVLPDEQQLEIIESRIRADQVPYMVNESNLSEEENILLDQVKNDCGLQEIHLSSLASLTSEEEQAGRDYLSIMYGNLSVLNSLMNE